MQKRSALHECVMDSGMQSEKSRFRDTQIWVFVKQPNLLVEINRRKLLLSVMRKVHEPKG